jgi:hypothetical protein
MHSRSRWVDFKNSTGIETPLLIPSFSSKGFAPVRVDRRKWPAPAACLKVLGGSAFESLLISAFDIHHKQILHPGSLKRGFQRSVYSIPQFLVIDSGWYESTVGADAGEPYEERRAVDWDRTTYEKTIDSLDDRLHAAVVSYDENAPYDRQISHAQAFFASRPRFVSIIMLKPPRRDGEHDLARLRVKARRLRAFDIIGIAEKELGNTVITRLKTVAELRRLLDESEVESPIHVFGALDPLMTPLYFAAGAEMFDGLSWFRYAYHDDLSIHRDSMLVLSNQLDKRTPHAYFGVQATNLDAIRELGRDLKVFHSKGNDWNVFRRADVLSRTYDALRSAVKEKHGR